MMNQVLIAMNILNKPMYRGTVDSATKDRNRRRNKAARKARRAARK